MDETERTHRIKAMLAHERAPFQKIGIGLHDGHFYFGVPLHNGDTILDAVVTDDQRIFIDWGKGKNNEIREKFGLNYRFPLYWDCIDFLWSTKSINRWLNEDVSEINPYALYQKIVAMINYLIRSEDPRANMLTACDIISNYFYPLFETKGRVYDQADPGSGKTKKLQIYQLLTFNPLMSANISGAALYRSIESTGGTILIDDMDDLPDDQKTANLQILRVGYKQGQKAVRSGEGKTRRPIGFNIYCPAIFNNVSGIDAVTEDRCTIQRLVKTDDEMTKRRIDPTNEVWGELRDQLHIFTLQNWRRVRVLAGTIKIPELSARDYERVEAVLVVAKLIGNGVYEDVLGYIIDQNHKRKIKDLSDDWLYMAIQQVEEIMGTTKEKWIFVHEIVEKVAPLVFEQFDPTYRDKRHKLSIYLGKCFRSFSELFKPGMTNGKSRYFFTVDALSRFKKIKGYDPTDSTNTTNSTLSTNLPNPINENNFASN